MTTGTELEDIMISEMGQSQKDKTVCFQLYEVPKRVKHKLSGVGEERMGSCSMGIKLQLHRMHMF